MTNTTEGSLFTVSVGALPRFKSNVLCMEFLEMVPQHGTNNFAYIDIISTEGFKAETSLLFVDEAFELFFNTCQDSCGYYLCDH